MIYLDAAVTIPTSKEVRDRMAKTLQDTWGNVSGAHQISRSAKYLLEEAREKCANNLAVAPDNIVFTSGATESLNLVIQGYARKHPEATIFHSAIEHPAVIKPAKYLAANGHNAVSIGVDASGVLRENELETIKAGDLVCVMPVNNEIGVENDIEKIANIVHKNGGLLLLDCVQSIYSFEPKALCSYADFAVFSSHKLGGPQGVGLLVIKDRKIIDPLTFGGSQEWELRPGTTPLFLIDAFALQLNDAILNREKNIEHLRKCQKVCIDEIMKQMPESKIHAFDAKRSPHIVSVDVGKTEAQMLVAMVDSLGVCVSRGSACASGAATPSPVLLALGIEAEYATSTLRLSFYSGTKIEEITEGVQLIAQCVAKLRESQEVNAK